jgi:class 3 adenylate cyclase
MVISRPVSFPIDLMWEESRLVRFLDRLSSFSRHVWFDPRGCGASDWIPRTEGRLPESVVDDMVAVLDDARCERVVVVGLAVPVGLLFAATHPERTKALVLVNSGAFVSSGDVEGMSDDELLERLKTTWFSGLPSVEGFGSTISDPEFVRWLARAQRLMVSPADAAWRLRNFTNMDMRAAFAAVRVPTLVVANRGFVGFDQCCDVAEQIEGAQFADVAGDGAWSFMTEPDPVADAIEEFVSGRLPTPVVDRVLATVLFTDVVGSTEHAARLGDRGWRRLLGTHHRLVRDQLERFRGREVKTIGDGFLATFDGPGRAIRCACAIRDRVRPLGVEIRAGLHAGEVELISEDIGGIAVHIGQRVTALASPGEVLVSGTVKDLVAGSGIDFDDRGEHELKGVPGTWKLFAVHA